MWGGGVYKCKTFIYHLMFECLKVGRARIYSAGDIDVAM